MGQLDIDSFDKVNIKNNPVSEAQLVEMYSLTASYEALFNKKAQKYKSLVLKDKQLTESEFKTLLLEEYTFLKRPVFIDNTEIFIGNDKKTVEKLVERLGKNN
jgi:arsenate reductase